MTRDSYDIVEEAVRKYWNENYPCDVVAFFWQKYDYEPDTAWIWCEEIVMCTSTIDNSMAFLSDFCEGQTCVKGIRIVSLDEVTAFYTEQKGLG